MQGSDKRRKVFCVSRGDESYLYLEGVIGDETMTLYKLSYTF